MQSSRRLIRRSVSVWIAALCCTACSVETPARPNAVLITVAGGDSNAVLGNESVAPSLAVANLFGIPSSIDPTLQVARALTLTEIERDAAAPFAIHVEGDLLTLAETLARREIETAMFSNQHELVEESGVLQGFFHLHDQLSLVGEGAADPAAIAASGALDFVGEKIPRPIEDAAFAWLHLDLDSAMSESTALVADTFAAFRSLLEDDSDAVLALWFVGDGETPGTCVFLSSNVDATPRSLTPVELGQLFLQAATLPQP